MTRLNDNGRIVIPSEIRQKMGLKPGDVLVLYIEGERLIAEPQHARVRRVQESLGRLISSEHKLSRDLTADRRVEVQGDMEEWLG